MSLHSVKEATDFGDRGFSKVCLPIEFTRRLHALTSPTDSAHRLYPLVPADCLHCLFQDYASPCDAAATRVFGVDERAAVGMYGIHNELLAQDWLGEATSQFMPLLFRGIYMNL